jgi:hypothetical protein
LDTSAVSGSVPDSEAPAEIIGDARIEASSRGGGTTADGRGPMCQRAPEDGRTVREAREEHPGPPLLVSLSSSLVGEIEGEHGVKGLHRSLLGMWLVGA